MQDDRGSDIPPSARLQIERLVGDLQAMYQQNKERTSGLQPIESRPRRILVVEDHPETRRLVCMSLGMEEEFEVLEAETGDSGLAKAIELHPDLVVLDVQMPGALDGLQVCRALKALARPPRVLLLTSYGGRARENVGRRAGADAYLVKPVSPLQLIETIQNLLNLA